MEGPIRVKQLYLYPVKACKGIPVSEASIFSTGFQWDRQWLVVNTKGRMLTQRIDSKLALVEVSLPMEALENGWSPLKPDSALSLKAPGMEPLQVPLTPSKALERIENVSVWDWKGSGFLEGPDATRWFSEYLGKPSQLVRFDTDVNRPTDPKYADGFTTTFTDGFPFLVISQPSLDALNKRLTDPLPIKPFPIFVEGCEAFAEDTWHTFTIGQLTFHGVKLCSRCKVTTIDQGTGEGGQEPLRTLRDFRVGQLLSSVDRMRNQVYFGQNATCDHSLLPLDGSRPTVRVGDAIHIIRKAPVADIMS